MDIHVSLIIPIYNAAPFLERCLDSALAQTEPQLEIICIDDASTDSSRGILEAYARKDHRFRVVLRESNGGESVTRNQGISLARGEYLAFLDHDDTLEPDACRQLYAAAKATGADIAKGRIKICKPGGKCTVSEEMQQKNISEISKFYFYTHWWSAIYRTSKVQNKIFFAEGYPLGADLLFLTDALITANFVTCIEDIVYIYMRHTNNTDSEMLSSEKIASVIQINTKIMHHLHAANIDSLDKDGYLQQTWVRFYAGIRYILRSTCRNDRISSCKYMFNIMDIHKYPDRLKSIINENYPQFLPLLYETPRDEFMSMAADETDKLKQMLSTLWKLRYRVNSGFSRKKL